jgi:hypothetical protein
MIMNIDIHTNYIPRLINECRFSLKRIILGQREYHTNYILDSEYCTLTYNKI